ncbi:MAG: permease-like cell division protein FtsX [Candidatus Zixiibacteriota bacterium]
MPRRTKDRRKTPIWSALILLSLIILPFGLTTLVIQNLGEYERSLRSKLKFEIYLRDTTTPEQVQTLLTQIKSLEGFVDFSYRDREEVFADMQSTLGTQLLPENSANPFPSMVAVSFDAYHSKLSNFDDVAVQMRKFPFIEEVNYGAEWLAAHERTFNSAEQILSALKIITGACAFLLMFWFMRRVILSQEQYYTVLRRLGAGWKILAFPFILRKTLLGIAAAAVSLIVLYACFRFVTGWSIEIDFVTQANVITILGFGGFVSLFSSTLAVSREV